MKIAVLANDEQWQELSSLHTDNECIRVNSLQEFLAAEATLYIYLLDSPAIEEFSSINQPLFINSVSDTLKELNAQKNIYRINGWPGFLQRPVWEISGERNEVFENKFLALQKHLIFLPDNPGFPSANIVSMIINEAYFALQENVSTPKEIDTAMKLGTNYPYGPFEWAEKIGVENIYSLLKKLSENEKRYTPATQLKTAIK